MVVYTVGTFDLLHVGHLALLEYCATLGDVVAVGVASDQVVNSYKPKCACNPSGSTPGNAQGPGLR